ncbi:MAG: 3-hydroxyacyl-ACP dehydratase FabZ family protein [Gemmataceae bacterium]
MQFNLLDRIVSVEPGRTIQGVKNLTLGEEYLADHFPTFPVMPGVLMLQSLVEAGAWLLRISNDFKHSVIVLREAKNVKYGHFMEPGKQMLIQVELVEQSEDQATLKGKGEVEGQATVSAKLTLAQYNLRDRHPAWHTIDDQIVAHLRSLHAVLREDLLAKPVST